MCMRLFIASVVVALGIIACGSYGGGSQPAGGGASAAPRMTAEPQPANATNRPAPSTGDMDDPYGYGY